MTGLPPPSKKKLGLVIDLDTCVGCHACAVSCKEWNAGGIAGPLTDSDPYGKAPDGVWFNRVHSYEVLGDGRREEEDGESCASSPSSRLPSPDMTLHFPRSCLHCETPACVTVCPTGASYKRAEDGIVLVDEDKCIGCKLCSWACPYGAREYSPVEGVMKKCTLCVDRIYNEHLDEADRQPACVQACPSRARHFGDLGDPESDVSKLVAARNGVDLMPEFGYRPTNKYLPPRPRRAGGDDARDDARGNAGAAGDAQATNPLKWLDRILGR
jgi:Fe-S-cluster-containing dehydrogenase component